MRGISIFLLWAVLFTGCNRNDLCYTHPHENLYVEVIWDQLSEHWQNALPEGVRISLYAAESRQEGGAGTNYTYYRDTYGGKILAANGDYDLLVFNSDTEKVQFRNMESIRTAEVYLETRTRKPYTTKAVSDRHIYYPEGTRANKATQSEELIGETDELFATYCAKESINTNTPQQLDVIYAHPENRVLMVTLTLKVLRLEGAASCRASLSGVAQGLRLATGVCIPQTGTTIFDMNKQGDTFLSQTIHVFGINKSPEGTPDNEQIQHLVQLEFKMRDNTVVKYECDVTDQIDFDAIRPEIVIPLEIGEVELPEIEIPDTPGGGFDADINDWGEETTIVIK